MSCSKYLIKFPVKLSQGSKDKKKENLWESNLSKSLREARKAFTLRCLTAQDIHNPSSSKE